MVHCDEDETAAVTSLDRLHGVFDCESMLCGARDSARDERVRASVHAQSLRDRPYAALHTLVRQHALGAWGMADTIYAEMTDGALCDQCVCAVLFTVHLQRNVAAPIIQKSGTPTLTHRLNCVTSHD